MTTPHKATKRQWANIALRAKANEKEGELACAFSTDSVLCEVADRVAAMEAVLASHGEQISGLHSQHNLVVDNITDLQGCVNTLKAAATQPPAPAADHLGRQHAAQSRQEEDPSQLSDGYHTFAELYEHRHALFLALMRAMPQHCWFSLRHADGERCFGGDDWFIAGAELPGGSSVTYHLPADLYSLAKATGASRLDLGRPWDGHTASDVVSRLMEWAAQVHQEREVVPVLWVQKKPGPGCNASVIAWLPSVGDLPIGEHILYAFPGASQPRQEDLLTQPAPLSSSIEAGIDRFGEWLAREMPPGTVIGDPLNWAPRIAIAVLNACQEVEPTPPPAPVTPGCGSTSKAVGFAAAPLLWVLWHHLGASSPVGQPIRRYLGMGQHDRMTPEGIEAAKRWARESMGVKDYLDSIPSYSSDAPEPTPPPSPAGGLVQSVAGVIWKTCDLEIEACNVIHAVADWLQQRSNTIGNGSQWAEMLRRETKR